MNSRERVLTSTRFCEPDRVPYDYWGTSEVTEALCERLGFADKETLLKHLGVDLRYVRGPSYVGQAFRTSEDGSIEDLWGVRRGLMRATMPTGLTWTYKHVTRSPLEQMTSAAQIEAYDHWPSPDWWNYGSIVEECLHYSEYAIVNAGDRLDRTAQFKPMMYLRGSEQSYVDGAPNNTKSLSKTTNPECSLSFRMHLRNLFRDLCWPGLVLLLSISGISAFGRNDKRKWLK